MKTDLEIARAAKMRPVAELAADWFGLAGDDLCPHGHHKAKLPADLPQRLAGRPDGKLVLVTAITPTPAGEGKTTTSVGLADALNRIGKKTAVALREPSLGPVFGMKGGAAGGGRAQVVPMEDINLHFTGDFAAVGLAHNLLSALVDNHMHHGNELGLDSRRVAWRRVVDMNDRALRNIVVGLGGPGNGFSRADGFDIVVASEIMAILCLADSLGDLKRRVAKITVGHTRDKRPVLAGELQAAGAMTALLKDAIRPNLAQTLENTPAFIHGGPFANIAHGCNSVLATRTALKLCDFVVTEAGFGADLGAEKFVDIKCRKSGLRADAAVLVATIRALKFHGGAERDRLGEENLEALRSGFENMRRHMRNIREHYGLPMVAALNHFSADTGRELDLIRGLAEEAGCDLAVCRHWAEGGRGAEELAEKIAALAEGGGGGDEIRLRGRREFEGQGERGGGKNLRGERGERAGSGEGGGGDVAGGAWTFSGVHGEDAVRLHERAVGPGDSARRSSFLFVGRADCDGRGVCGVFVRRHHDDAGPAENPGLGEHRHFGHGGN